MKYYVRVLSVAVIVMLASACSESNKSKFSESSIGYSEVIVDSIKVLDLESKNVHPVFSDDDQYIYYTTIGYDGIYRCNVNTFEVDTITSLGKSGYSFEVVNDKVYYIISNYDSQSRSRSSELIKHDIESGSEDVIYSADRRIQGVTKQNNGQLSFFVRDSLFVYDTQSGDFLDFEDLNGSSYLISKGKIRYITSEGISEHTISDKHNIAAVEPVSRDSVLISLARKGLFLFNPQTGSVDSMNSDFFPKYDGRNLYAYTYQATDGHKIDTSRIFIKSLDGSIKTPVSTDRLNLDENPAWSNNGRMLAYNNFNGQLKIAYLSYR